MDQSDPKLTPNELQHPHSAKKRRKKPRQKSNKKEKKRQLKRDHLNREIKLGELTMKKYESEWKELLVKIALPRMRTELEFAWHSFERVIDCKDFQISLLMDELRRAEEQQMFSVSAHLEGIGSLMKLFDERLDELREDWEKDVENLQNQQIAEVDDMSEVKNENFNYMKTMLHQLEIARRRHERIQKVIYFSKLDESEVKHLNLFQKLKATLEKKYQNMFEVMKQFIKSYDQQKKKKRKALKELKNADDAIQKMIAQQFKKIQKLQDTCRQMRQAYLDLLQEEGSVLAVKQSQRKYFCDCYLALKSRLHFEKETDFKKFAVLSESSARAIDKLENVQKKGEQVLRLGDICRKFETQNEKIMPFWSQGRCLTKSESRKADDDEELPGGAKELQLFWQHLGEVYNVFDSLRREKNYLKDENEVFVECHNNYCDKLEDSHNWKTYQERPPGTYIPRIEATHIVKTAKFQNPLNRSRFR